MFRPRTIALVAGLVVGLLAYASSALDSAFARRADCAGWPADWLGLPVVPPADRMPDEGAGLRVVTYNLHAGLGEGWRWFAPRAEVEANLRRIARHLAEAAPADDPVDVVALNEVDFASRRSGWLDQAAFLAAELEDLTGARYQVVRGPTWERDAPGLEVRFGNAILTRHPIGRPIRRRGPSGRWTAYSPRPTCCP